ncbi:retrovirus-related pol polyprotein from transposon TNT 1-94 [Tanacetum coccineum]
MKLKINSERLLRPYDQIVVVNILVKNLKTIKRLMELFNTTPPYTHNIRGESRGYHNCQYVLVWGCEAHVKRHTPDKLQQRSVKCIFVGHPQETMGYYFYYPPENKIVVERIDPDRLSFNIEVEEHSLGDLYEPANYKAAYGDPEFEKWLVAMNEEMQSMNDNKVWKLVVLPPNAKVVKSKWIYKKKTDMEWQELLRILIAIAAYYDYEIWQMDVKTVFLNGFLEEEIYMEQPEGFIDPNHPKMKRSKLPMDRLGSHMYAVRNTKDTFFVDGGNPEAELQVKCYCDAGFETDRDDTKSQTREGVQSGHTLPATLLSVRGEGGFGRVYSGILEDGTKVAVKVLKRDDQQGSWEFMAIVEMLGSLHYRNLVRLLGICTEERNRCLVYELIPNGSVESHLHGSCTTGLGARLKIALGAARGFAYLHEDSSPRVIHRDFKSSNILLEHDFTPKVFDFGLARSALDEENQHISTRVMDTFGDHEAEDIRSKLNLGAHDAWEFVTTEYEEPPDAEIGAMTANQLKALKEKRMKAKDALYLLFQSVDESGFEKIVGASTAKEAWKRCTKALIKSNKYDSKHCVAKDVEELTIEELAGSLEANEQRKNRKKQESLDEALQTKATIKEEKALYAQQNNYSRGNNTRGHNTNRGRGRKRTEENTNLVTEPDVVEGGVLLMAHEEPVLEVDMIWYLDSGASHHMSGQRTELTEVIQGHVSFGDASKIEVKGHGNIRFLYDEEERSIEDVYYVPAMKSNILSLGQLMEKGYSVLMKNGKLLLKNREGSFRALVNMCKNRTFKLDLNSVGEKCFRSDLTDKESVWHIRFGHLHFNGLKELARKNMVHGLPNLNYDDHFCEDCVLGKQTWTSFPRNANYRAKELLELIHSDLCGPHSPVSFGNKRYFVTFIDDFSRKCWVYFMGQKSEAFESFKKIKAMVEKTTVRICLKNSGQKRFSVRYTSRCPHVKLMDMTPQECWSGVKPTISHFKVFGSVAYHRVPDQTRTKLDDKNKKYIFIGYDDKSKAFSLYDPIEKKVTVSRDVYVNEESTWDWNNRPFYKPHNNTQESIPKIAISATPNDQDSENEDEPVQQRTRSLQDLYESTTEMHLVWCVL